MRKFRVAKSKVDSLPSEVKTNFLRHSTSNEENVYSVPFYYVQDITIVEKFYKLTLVRKDKNNKLFTKTIEVFHLPEDFKIKHGRYYWHWKESVRYRNQQKIKSVISVGEPLIEGHPYDEKSIIVKSSDLPPSQISPEILKHNNLLRELIGYESFSGQLHDTTITCHATRDEKHDYFVWELSTDKFKYGKRNKLVEITKLFPNDYKEIVEFDENGKYVSHETILLKKEYREDTENFSIVELEHRKYTPEKSTGLDYQEYEEKETHIAFSETIIGAEAMFDRL
jgi:hypothetical protein